MTKIIGNGNLLNSLEKMAASGRVPHGIILSGAEGTGKNLIADRFASMLGAGQTDIIRLNHEKPNLISVDDVRRIVNSTVSIKPYSGKYKLYIIDEAEKMNVPAQNALLKTIEEPPEYVVIMLLTVNSESFLQTILSRCVLLKTLPVSDSMVEEELIRQGVPEEHIKTAVSFAEGSIGKALTLSNSEEFKEMVSGVKGILKNAGNLRSDDILLFNGITAKYKTGIYDLLSLIRMWFADVLTYKAGRDESLIRFSEDRAFIISQSKKLDFASLFEIENLIDETESRLKSNVNFEAVTESLILGIINRFST